MADFLMVQFRELERFCRVSVYECEMLQEGQGYLGTEGSRKNLLRTTLGEDQKQDSKGLAFLCKADPEREHSQPPAPGSPHKATQSPKG